MPSERFVTSVAAGATSANLLEDSTYKYLPQGAVVRVYGCADAAGQLLELMFGNVVDTRAFELVVRATTVGPFRSDDLSAEGVAAGGDLVSVRVRNTTAGAVVNRVLIDIKTV